MKTHSPHGPPLRDRIREVTSVAILDAAEVVAEKVGLASVSLQAIAEHAGTAVGTLYNYFDDKEALLAALFARRRSEFCAAIDASSRAHAHAPFEEQLGALVRAVLPTSTRTADFLRIALDTGRPLPSGVKPAAVVESRPVMDQLFDRATSIVKVGLREKKIRPDAAILAPVAFVATLRGVLIMKRDAATPLSSYQDAIVSYFMHGVAK